MTFSIEDKEKWLAKDDRTDCVSTVTFILKLPFTRKQWVVASLQSCMALFAWRDIREMWYIINHRYLNDKI